MTDDCAVFHDSDKPPVLNFFTDPGYDEKRVHDLKKRIDEEYRMDKDQGY